MPNRQIEMLKTAMPYTMPNFRKPIQILIQVQELASFMQNSGEEPELEACDIENAGDIEGMMENLREFCTAAERDTVDLILNYVRVQRMYQTYRGYMASTGKQTKGFGSQKSNGSFGGNNQMMEFLMSQLTPEQQNTFAQMSSVLNTD